MTKIAASQSRSRRIRRLIVGAAALPLLLTGGAAREDAAAGMIAAERRFAADAMRIGITPAFSAHVAPDAILIRPDPAPALAVLAKEVDTPGVLLEWRPAIAAVAQSGDLGFTTGPYRVSQGGRIAHGRFLTVWERESDGAWRWYLDHGLPPVGEGPGEDAPAKVAILRQGLPAKGAPDAAEGDAALNAAIVANGTSVIARYLAPDGHLLRVKRGMVKKTDAVDGGMPVRAAATLGIRVSAAGDLAAAYGRLAGAEGEPPHHYVRVWRRDRAGWRLLVDEIV
ncbi:MAG: nuclear transport factor 2 family protein [Proteobacteria bacterium]|nr:nuclear transport factor 2 family protein [Pseudomonadota bacterium]